MKTNQKSVLTGISGVHHVVSELSRRGLVALPTIRNLAAYDVLVSTLDGRRHANLQVKASGSRVNFFPMPEPARIRSGPNDWYVLLRWLKAEDRYEGFMLSGKAAKAGVLRDQRTQEHRIRYGNRSKLFPALPVGPTAGRRADDWRKCWLAWTLEGVR